MKHTRESQAWKPWPGVISGGQAWINSWKRKSGGVSPVRCIKRILLKHRCTLGSGQVALGLACIWIMQGHLWERCSRSSWMPTRSGWMCIQCHLPPQCVTITYLRRLFAIHSLPETIVTDNGSVFTSAKFTEFTTRNGIHHSTSAPFHPASNSLAERTVHTFKAAMRKQESGSLDDKLACFLFRQHITSHSTMGETLAKLLMGQQLRSHLSQMHPDLERKVSLAQSRQKEQHDKGAQESDFLKGWWFSIHVQLFGRYSLGTWSVVQETGPVSVRVELEGAGVARRHHDQLLPQPSVPGSVPVPNPQSSTGLDSTMTTTSTEGVGSPSPTICCSPGTRYPACKRHPPPHLQDFV